MGFLAKKNKVDLAADQQQAENFLEKSFGLFIQLLVKKWWLFCIIGALAGTAGIIKASMQVVRYESKLSFVVDEGGGNNGLSGAINLAAQFGLNIGGSGDIFSGDNIIEIIKSRRLVENVLLTAGNFGGKSLTFAEFFIQNSPNSLYRRSNIHFQAGQQRNTFTYSQDSLLHTVFQDFATQFITAERPDKKYNIFSLQILSFNEQFSKEFTEKLIDAADSFYIEICSRKARETLEVLERRVSDMKGNLSGSISSRAATQDANINPAFAAAQVPIQQQQSNIQVYGAAYAEMFKNLELARFQYLNRVPLIQIIDGANYPMKKIRQGKLKTGLFFAFGATFALAFLMWLVRIYRLNS